MLNKISLIGNLGRDPEVRTTNAGNKIVSMSVATSEKWKDKETGEQNKRTEWHRVVIFNEKIGGLAEKYLKKGMQVYIEGTLRTRSYMKDDVKTYVTEIVLERFNGEMKFLSGKELGDQTTSEASFPGKGKLDDDEVPF